MDKIQFIDKVFDLMIEKYQIILKNYYPAFDSNGFTERNLTFNFCNSYLDISKKVNEDIFNDVIVWQEVPLFNTQSNNHNNHIDSVIIDKKSKIIIFIEAKRIRNSNTYKLLKEDIFRISKNQKIPNIDIFKDYKKYAIFLTDIWISKLKKDIRNKKKQEMEIEFDQKSILVYNPPNIEFEDYYINYKIITL
jgi:hypothetical protein